MLLERADKSKSKLIANDATLSFKMHEEWQARIKSPSKNVAQKKRPSKSHTTKSRKALQFLGA